MGVGRGYSPPPIVRVNRRCLLQNDKANQKGKRLKAFACFKLTVGFFSLNCLNSSDLSSRKQLSRKIGICIQFHLTPKYITFQIYLIHLYFCNKLNSTQELFFGSEGHKFKKDFHSMQLLLGIYQIYEFRTKKTE